MTASNPILRRGMDFIEQLETDIPWDTETQALVRHAGAYHNLMRRLLSGEFHSETSRQLIEQDLRKHREAIHLLMGGTSS